MLPLDSNSEWLETDGLGGFASGTVSGVRTRRYHALLLAAATPPSGRFVLVNGFDAWVELPSGQHAISSQRYAPDALHPDGARRLEQFEYRPWPHWRFRLEEETRLEQELFVRRGAPLACLSWRLSPRIPGAALRVRPFFSGRDYHALQRENAAFRFEPEERGGRLIWRPYPGVPGILSFSNGAYHHEPLWYRNFMYEEERARGLDCVEDLASPGTFRFDLSQGEAVWLLAMEGQEGDRLPPGAPAEVCHQELRLAEAARRQEYETDLDRAAADYLVRRGKGLTIVAGYPWFTDWGRDAFIALRGLCLAAGRLEEARQILLGWAGAVSQGMLPNRFPDQGESPEYNSVDASLWYVVAAGDFLEAMKRLSRPISPADRQALKDSLQAILSGYSQGTRYGIRADADGLLAAGEPGSQLTWMDAKVGDWTATPRIGKPVEVEALWLNALWIGSRFSREWERLFKHGLQSFQERFWNEARGCLFDVIDCDHRPGTADPALRPNQIFAAGGLPVTLVEPARATRTVEVVEANLWTPMGLRSLAPGEPGYAPRYRGGARERDGAYHQGTVWPWLLGPFAEAWVKSRGSTDVARRAARARFFDPLLRHLDEAGLGHISEIADAEPPHAPRGCPFQAWSVGEALRLDRLILVEKRNLIAEKSS